MRFTPGTHVHVVFDRVTSFNGRTGVVVAIPADIAPSIPSDVLVELLDGSEAGRKVFFAKEELRIVRPLLASDMLYMDALQKAAIRLQSRENEAAAAEGLGPICSTIVAIYTYHDGSRLEMRVLFDYGQVGDRTGKTARIVYINDMNYLLEWV